MLTQLRAWTTRIRLAYLGIALVIFFVATLVSDVRSRVVLGGEKFDVALRDHLYWAAVQVPGTVLLAAPFVVIAWWAEKSERDGRKVVARSVFLSFLALFFWQYWSAYHEVPGYLAKRMWTAATLTIGLLPFYALGYFMLFVIGDWLIRLFLRQRNSTSDLD